MNAKQMHDEAKQCKARKITKVRAIQIKAKQSKANASQGKAVKVGQSKGKACRIF